MLVFFLILLILILIVIPILVYLSGIKIQLEQIDIERKDKLEVNNFKMNILFLLFNKFRLFKIVIDKEKFKKVNFDKISKKLEQQEEIFDIKVIIGLLRRFNIESIVINAQLGLNDVFLLIYSVALIDIALSIIYARISNGNNRKNYRYTVQPLQTDKFYLKLSMNCIISTKTANIINMIIKNRSEGKNERTSNRSLNGNYHEQYTRYGRCKHYYRSTN